MSLKVLILAYFFPPYGGGYSIRVGKFAKYLPQFGWEPVVVSADPSSYSDNVSKTGGEIALTPAWRTSSMEKLLGRSGSGSGGQAGSAPRSYTNRILQKAKHFFLIPDRQILWLPYAIAQSLKLYRDFKFRAILATAPPMSTILSALFLGRVLGLPVILDLRDDWSGTATFKALPNLRQRLESWLEGFAIKRTQYLVVPTNRSYDRYRRVFKLPASRIGLIANGFDPEDFANLPVPSPPAGRDRRLCLMHLGNLPPSRSPLSLLRALQQLAEEAPDLYQQVTFVQVGFVDETFRPFFEPLMATGGARMIRPVPHHEAIALMSAADILVLIPSQGTPTAIPGKVYEYLATRRPIMALVEPGATQNLLEQARANWLANVHDIEAIIKLIKALVAARKNADGIPTGISEMFLSRFDRREQAKNLAFVLSEVTQERPASSGRA